jgi:hypothetical protein
MTKDLNIFLSHLSKQELIEALIAGTIQLTAIIPGYGPFISAASTLGYAAYQSRNINQANHLLRKHIATIDETKLDREFIDSDEFRDIMLQYIEATMKTSSELRCDALVKVFCSCFTKPTSTYINKQAMMRLVTQMSSEEMQVLYIIQREEQIFSENQSYKEGKSRDVQVSTIANQLEWNDLNTLIACQGLQQLNLVYDPEIKDELFMEASQPGDRGFRGTELGHRLVEFAHGGTWSY